MYRLREVCTEVSAEGNKGDVRGNSRRLRVGKYRIIYNYLPNGEIEILYIIDVDSRGDIYK